MVAFLSCSAAFISRKHDRVCMSRMVTREGNKEQIRRDTVTAGAAERKAMRVKQ